MQKRLFGYSPLERGDAGRQRGKQDYVIIKKPHAKFNFLSERGNLSYTLLYYLLFYYYYFSYIQAHILYLNKLIIEKKLPS